MTALAIRRPETRYAEVGDAHVAYQVFGEGSLDVVYVPGFASAIDAQWDVPGVCRFFERMASYARVIVFDRRGSGSSDHLPLDALPTWEEWAEDLRAVLDAAGSERAAIVAEFESGPWGLLFAASHPERTNALVLWNSFAKYLRSDDFPFGADPARFEDLAQRTKRLWGSLDMVRILNPSLADDPVAGPAFARVLRASATPRAAAAMYRYWGTLDARDALRLINVPTLIMRRSTLPVMNVEVARHLAQSIKGARYVEVPGSDVFIWANEDDGTQEALEEFLTGAPPSRSSERIFATVVFTDIVGATERLVSVGDRRWKGLLGQHDRILKDQIERARGRLVDSTGDGVLATFDGPARAIRCAMAIRDALREIGLQIRVGIHAGEIEIRDGSDVGGFAIHLAARVMALAGADEILCSRTVRDLVAGSGLVFKDRGTHALKGFPDAWDLYAVC